MSTEDETGVAPEVEEPESSAIESEAAQEPAETVDETGEESATSEDDEEQKEPKRSRRDRRIDVLTKEKYDAQRQAEQYARQLQDMQQQIAAQQQPQIGNDFPTLEQYGYDESQYQRAVVDWHQNQQRNAQEQQMQQHRMLQEQQAAVKQQQTLQQTMSRGQEKYPDFISKVNDPSLPPLREINPAAFEAVISSDDGVDVAYYLANNPQEVYALASMSPVQAIRKVAQLESRLTAKPSATNPPPAPPSKVRGKAEAVKDPSKMSAAEWIEERNRKLHSK